MDDRKRGSTNFGPGRPTFSGLLVFLGAGAAVVALLLLAVAGPGARFGAWPFRTGFTMLGWAAWLGLGAAGVSVLGLVVAAVRRAGPRPRRVQGRRRSWWLGVVGVVLGLGVAAVPWHWRETVAALPFIHDISTDTADPPRFVTLLAARADAPNRSDYGGPKVAALQAAAYPDIAPVVLAVPVDETFRRAVDAAHRLGWDVVALVAAEGRIEATDTTTWFGFKDDIVVRVRPAADGSGGARVDVRSVSRVGRSDAGANARRIGKFLDLLRG